MVVPHEKPAAPKPRPKVSECARVWHDSIDGMEQAGHAGDLEHVRSALRRGGIKIVTKSEPEHAVINNTPAVKRRLPMCKERVSYYMEICALEELADRPNLL